VKLKCEDEVCSLVSHNQHKSTGRESGNVTNRSNRTPNSGVIVNETWNY